MTNSAVNDNPELQKRRSERIEQAVPLTVMGVDALGRPFLERTSTLIINSHGCRYQSKHYVLKNMWVTLQVPHSEAGREPRSVRARVMWVRRPHSVRELFQIGVELESPGNIWGIAFPPPDWFPFPEGAAAPAEMTNFGVGNFSSAARNEVARGEAIAEQTGDAGDAPNKTADTFDAEPEPNPGNVRTIPLGGVAEPSVTLARQMSRLVSEARQQLQTTVRESAAQAVAAETRPLIAALQTQLRDAARISVEAAAEQPLQAAVDQAVQDGEARLEEMCEYWNRQLQEGIEQATQSLNARLGEVQSERHTGFAAELESESRNVLAKVERASHDFESRLGEAQQRVESLSRETDHIAATMQSDWQAQLDARVEAAAKLWDERVEAGIEAAAQRTTERLTRRSEEVASQFDEEIQSRIANAGANLLQERAAAEERLAALRASFDERAAQALATLAHAENVIREADGQTERFEEMQQTAFREADRRAAAVLEAQTLQLASRAEAALTAWSEHLRPMLESAGGEVIARLGAELEMQLQAQSEQVARAMDELQKESRAAAESLRRHEETLGKISDQAVQSAVSRVEAAVGPLECGLEETVRAAAAKWIAEMETKSNETVHTTFESMFKTADWYEKKIQSQMQASLEKGLDQAGAGLRDKAREMSALFASEMDHYSRSYAEHTHGQIEEMGRESLESLRQQFADVATGATVGMARETQNQMESVLARIRGKAADTLSQASSQLSSSAAQTRAKFDADFHAAVTEDAQQALRAARQDLAAQVETARESVRAEAGRQGAELREAVHSLGEEAMESYRSKLENTSNSWLLTTAAKLNQQSSGQIDALARSAETRLRETCAQVFADVGESLRRRLLDLAAQPPAYPAGEQFTTDPSK